MLRSIIKALFLVSFLFTVVACGTSKKVVEEADNALPKVKDEILIFRLDSLSKQRPESFYAKFNSKYEDNESNVSFKTSVRMTLDSAVQTIITYAKIPIYNSLVTPDSVTLVDKRRKCYINEGMAYFKKAFNVDFNYKNIEELILGLPIAWDKSINYYQVRDPFNYIISTPKQDRVTPPGSKNRNLSIRYYFKDDARTLEKTIIESLQDSTVITISYYDYQMVDNFNIPQGEDIHIATPRNNIYVDLKYVKISINEPRILYLSIPNKYEKCEE